MVGLLKLLPLFLTVFFSTLATLYPEFNCRAIFSFKLSSLGYYILGFFNQRFFIEFFYNKLLVMTVLNIGDQTTKVLDKGSIEWIGPYGIGVMLNKISKTVSNLSKGIVTEYALYMLIGLCLYLFIFTYPWEGPKLISIIFDVVNSTIISCVIILITKHNFSLS